MEGSAVPVHGRHQKIGVILVVQHGIVRGQESRSVSDVRVGNVHVVVEVEAEINRSGTLVIDSEVAIEDVIGGVDPVREGKPQKRKVGNSETRFDDRSPPFIGSGEDVVRPEPGKGSANGKADSATSPPHMVLFSNQGIGELPNEAGLIEGDIKTTIRDREFPGQYGSFDTGGRTKRLSSMLLLGPFLCKVQKLLLH
jgi:hypothetical protein